MTEIKRCQLALSLPTSYYLERDPDSQKGLLVLHGYADLARSARRRLLGTSPLPNYTSLSPNGLFPCPVEKDDGFKEAYSWYFKDPQSGVEMISPEFAANALLKLIDQLKLNQLEWIILGFSQGGFFAPYLVHAGLTCNRIISCGAAYQSEKWKELKNLTIHAIHGEQDTDVPFEIAQQSFQSLKNLAPHSQFHPIPDLGHSMNEAGRELIRKLLATPSTS